MITYACMMAVPLSTVKALTVCAISHRLNKTKNSNLVVADRGVPNVRHSSGESSRDLTSSKGPDVCCRGAMNLISELRQ